MSSEKVTEVVGIFEGKEALNAAIAELEATEFSREKLSVLGSQIALEEYFGKTEVPPEQAGDDPAAPRTVPVHPEEEALGTAAMVGGGAYVGAVGMAIAAGAAFSVPAMLAAAAIGGGAGSILVKLFGDYYNEHIESQIDKGGLLLWVQTPTDELEQKAKSILDKHGAQNIHTHVFE